MAGISSAGSVSVSPSTVISTSSISEYDLVSLWCCGGPTRTEPANTGGRPPITRRVHHEFIMSSETKRPTLTRQAHSEHFYKLPFNSSSPYPVGGAQFLLQYAHGLPTPIPGGYPSKGLTLNPLSCPQCTSCSNWWVFF